MCGICGIVGSRNDDLAESRVREMMRRIEHRGPDEGGVLARRRAVLGMRRLSIIDLGGGSQPVFNEDGAIGVVFNGEIYNFPELRAELENRGHRFRTHSDTEVIVHAYEEWGERCPEHLRGMFAFALWDGRGAQQRRPSGRPRFCWRAIDSASSLSTTPRRKAHCYLPPKCARCWPAERFARKVARESVEAYLLFGSVVEPMTLVEGVFSLPPGHSLMFRLRLAVLRPSPRPTGISRLRRARPLRMRRSDLRFSGAAPCAPCSKRRFAAISWRMSRSGFF